MSESQRRALLLDPYPGAQAPIASWLAALQDARQRTLSAVEDLPARAVDAQDERGHAVGTLLYHIAAIEADWLYTEVLQRAFPPELEPLFPVDVRDDQGRLAPVHGESLAQHLQRLATVRSALLAAYTSMTAEDFVTPRRLAEYDVSPEWVLHHLMQHEAEHRSQLVALRDPARS